MIKRPKQVERSQKNYLSNEKYQDYAEKQFKTIYDYLDGKVSGKVIYDGLSNTNITFNEQITDGEIEIFYARKGTSNITEYNKSTGRIPFTNNMKYILDIAWNATDIIQLISEEITIKNTGIDIDSAYYVNLTTNGVQSFGVENHIFIKQVKFYK